MGRPAPAIREPAIREPASARRREAVSPDVLFSVASGPAGKDHRPAVAVVAAFIVLLTVCGGAFTALSLALH
ncbi:hypothetical protein ACTI_72510 [Actinoplanes sp. OR16]|nr:hypothetical protein ACTI_72510 [Actinoplanes sp. OR16]